MAHVQLENMKEVPVGVLGATGTVGQRFIKLIAVHPFFRLAALGASSKSAGKPYSKAVSGRWKQTTPIPSSARDIEVQECVPEPFKSCAIIFSGLDADVAGDIGKSAFLTVLVLYDSKINKHIRSYLKNSRSERQSLLSSQTPKTIGETLRLLSSFPSSIPPISPSFLISDRSNPHHFRKDSLSPTRIAVLQLL